MHNETDTVRQTTALGTREVDHTVEPDTIAANGVTFWACPTTRRCAADLDSAGNQVSLNAQGEHGGSALPDGSIFSAGWPHRRPDRGASSGRAAANDFGPICAALGLIRGVTPGCTGTRVRTSVRLARFGA